MSSSPSTVPATTTTAARADSLAGVIVAGGIASTRTIQPTAIILHWWGSTNGSHISGLVAGLLGQVGYYDPTITRAQYDANVSAHVHGHTLGVQFAVTRDGRIYQLTPLPNSYAAHAACGNGWAIGIEIEGSGAADLHNDPVQFAAVVKLTGELMRRFRIPIDGPLGSSGLAGIGVHSHKEVDLNCKFADGSYAGQAKIDVDDAYLNEVRAALRSDGFQ